VTGTTDVDEVAELADRVAATLDGRLVACAESCTAGRVSASLAGVGGASNWLRGGLVAYQAETKRSVLHVTAPSVFSEQAAIEMVRGAARLFGAQVAVATTGVLGDEPEEGLPPGTLMVGTMVDGDVRAITRVVCGRDPEERCQTAVGTALSVLLDHLSSRA
jgi:nicotinamide-nucleotide amidase